MRWHAPADLEEALLLREAHGDDITVHAGGTFLGILMNQGLIAPEALLSLGRVSELGGIAVVGGELRLGAMATHLAVERHPDVRRGWPMLARAFSLVASRRVRAVATVGGVLADAGVREQLAQEYAARVEPISDVRGSAAYRRRVCAVEVRRALEALSA